MGSVWARLGVSIDLPKPNEEYTSEKDLVEAVVKALKEGKFSIDGDSYIPDLDDNFGFDSGGEINLGDL